MKQQSSPASSEKPTPPSLEEQLENLREQHVSDKHITAAHTLASLQARVADARSSPDEFLRAAAVAVDAKLSDPFFVRVATHCNHVLALRAALEERDESWTLSYSSAQTRVWYRREPHNASHSILTEGEIHAPLINVAALIVEADLYDRLFWYVTSAKPVPVNGGSMMKRGAHISVYAPWPLYKRDVAVYAYGVDALDEEEKCVMVVSRSMTEGDSIDPKGVPLAAKTIRVDMRNSGFELTPIAPGVLNAKFLFNVDPHLSFVPVALINWIARFFCRWSLRTLESRARDLSKMPPQYQQRIETEPIYEFIRRRLDEFWGKKGLSPEDAEKAESHAASQRRPSGTFDPDVTPAGPPASVLKQMLRGEHGDQAGTSGSRYSLSRLF